MFNFAIKHSRGNLIFFLLLTFAMLPGIFKLNVNTKLDQFINKTSPEFIKLSQIEKVFGDTNNIYILLTTKKGSILDKNNLKKIKKIEAQISEINGVEKTFSILSLPDMKISETDIRKGKLIEPHTSSNIANHRKEIQNSKIFAQNILFNKNKATLIVVKLSKKKMDNVNINKKFKKITLQHTTQHQIVTYVGLLKIEYYLNQETANSVKIMTIITSIIVFTCLFFFIRSGAAILIILIEILLSCIITLGFMGYLNIPINIFTSLAPILILVIGSTEIVHLLETYKKKHSKHKDNNKTIKAVIQSVYPSILLTSSTTIISFITLISSNLKMIEQFGIATTIGMTSCASIIFFLSPSLLKIITIKNIHSKKQTENSINEKAKRLLVNTVLKYNRIIIASFLLLTLACIYLSSTIEPNYSLINSFYKHPVKSEIKETNKNIGGTNHLYLSIETDEPDAFLYQDNLSKLFHLTSSIRNINDVTSATSFADIIALMHKKMNNNQQRYYSIPESEDIIDQYITLLGSTDYNHIINDDYNHVIIPIRHKLHDSKSILPLITTIQQQAKKYFGEAFSIHIVSKQYSYLSSLNDLVHENIYSIIALILILFILFCFLFHSILSGLMCFAINSVPLVLLSATTVLLNISPSPGCVIAFIIVFGVAVDDTIHFFTKYSQLSSAHDQSMTTIKHVIDYEFKPVLFTSVSLIAGFSCLLTSNLTEIITAGKLVTIGVFYSLICDFLLSPALLCQFRIINIVDLIKKSYDISTLQSSPIFSGFSHVELKKALLMSRIRHITQGSQLIKKGERTKSMYVIVSGSADVISATRTIPLTTGAVIGEMAYFSSSPRTADVFAQTDLTVVELNEKSLQNQMRFHKKILLKLNTNAISIIINRLSTTATKN